MIGHLGRPHGVRGALHARPTGATLETIRPGESLHVAPVGAPPRSLTVAGLEGAGERLRMRLQGVDDRDAAAVLAGATLAVHEERVRVPAEDDTFLVTDLLGCELVLGDRPLGPVTDVHSGPANDALEVAAADGPVLVPFTADAVRELDVAGRRIVVRADLLDG